MGERTRELFVLIAGDIAFFIAALWLTLLVRYFEWPSPGRLEDHLGPFLVLSAVWLLVFYISGLYDKHTVFLKKLLFFRIIYTQIANIILAAVLFLIIPFGIAPKTNLAIYLLISIALITTWRLSVFNLFSPKRTHKAILIADGKEAIELADEINNNDRYNYYFVRIIDERAVLHTEDFEKRLLELMDREGVDIIVANSRGRHMEKIMPAIFDLSFLRFEFTFIDFYKMYEDTFDRIPLSSLHHDWFITNVSQYRSPFYRFVKRGIDIVGALVLMIPFGIVFPFIAIAIKLGDNGVLFYRTERVGQYNQPVSIYKFRTKNGVDVGSDALNSKLVDTKVGSFLRKTRLDELPQLMNILKGDLSFIGPRPEMPTLATVYAEQIPYYNARHFIKPGLSGWAQIKDYDAPRGGVDLEKTENKLTYDLFYLKNQSLFLDIQIAMKTLATLIMRTGT